LHSAQTAAPWRIRVPSRRKDVHDRALRNARGRVDEKWFFIAALEYLNFLQMHGKNMVEKLI